MDKIAVLLPCYNESQTIAKVVCDFKRCLPNAVVYVYDNNSSDRTADIARNAGAIVRSEPKQGKGNVVRRMFREIDSLCYIIADGDDTYPADAAPDMARAVLEDGVDMVVGDRLSSTYFTQNKRPFHKFGNLFVRRSINTLFKGDIRDVMTGYRAFSYVFVKTFLVLACGFEIETEMSIHAVDKNLQVSNIIINYSDRHAGSVSKLNTYTDGIKVLRTIFNLYKDYKPLTFFLIISSVLLLTATSFFVPVLYDYIKTGLVPRFPSLIAAAFLALASVQSFFGGLILDNIRRKNRHDFEMWLIDIHHRIQDELRAAQYSHRAAI